MTKITPEKVEAFRARQRVLLDVQYERRRQIGKGLTPQADDGYRYGELATGGAAYAQAAHWQLCDGPSLNDGFRPSSWPFSAATWRPEPTARENLIKAAAMIVAEIERIDRAEAGGS